MRKFSKPIRRSIEIRSNDPTLGTAEWVVTMDAQGIAVRREGARKDTARRLPWRSIVGAALIFVKNGG